MNYILMRKNKDVTMLSFNEDGFLTHMDAVRDEDLLPLQNKTDVNGLDKWWRDRAVPISQGKIREMLETKNLISPGEYMLQNLGLSLTDYYWVKPVDSKLTWEDVNLFDNSFEDNLLFNASNHEGSVPSFTPNSTLQGHLEKTWSIDENGDRILIKGNRDYLSSESINEVIACRIHELQGFDNYVPYHLLHIKNRDYDYGCYSKLFTNQQSELVSAWAILTSDPKDNNRNSYEQFIHLSGKHGINEDELRHDLEYQIMTDFVMSNVDRHLNNVAVMRDADTLKFTHMAPIYDTGKSLFVGKRIPTDNRELFRTTVTGFANKELKLLKYVQDKSIVDISKLPDSEFIREMYSKDSQIDEGRINKVVSIYKHKVDLLDKFQHGHDINPYYSKESSPRSVLIHEILPENPKMQKGDIAEQALHIGSEESDNDNEETPAD